jgi:hypothetical protein
MSQKNTRSKSIDDTYLEDIIERACNTCLNKIDPKLTTLDKKLDRIVEDIASVRKDSQANTNAIKNLSERCDKMDGITRKNVLRMDGLRNIDNGSLINQVLNIINKQLKVDCSENHINEVSRLKGSEGKDSTILVKFVTFWKRNEVFKAKKLLKGTGIFINEDLSKNQYELLKMARKKIGNHNVWSAGGKIFAKGANGIYIISSSEEIEMK